MGDHSVTHFLVEIDGKPTAAHGDLLSAKAAAILLTKGLSSVKIMSVGPGTVPSSSWYWDYAISDWVFSQNTVFAEAKRKDE